MIFHKILQSTKLKTVYASHAVKKFVFSKENLKNVIAKLRK